jgi:hypothetical protein
MRNVTNPQFTPGSLPPVFLEPRAPQIEHYEIDLTPILPGRSIHLHRTVAQRSGEAANTHRIGDRGEVWCGVVWYDVDGRLSGTEILNTRRVDAACETSEGSVRRGGDYPCSYSIRLNYKVLCGMYCTFLFSFGEC